MQDKPQIEVAVVTGRHPFDVLGFHALFRSMPDADPYIQNMEEFAASPEDVRDGYGVVVFYNFHQESPTGEGPFYDRRVKDSLEHMGSTKQGIFVLHHAILAYPKWPLWSEVVGIEDRRFGFHIGESIHVDVANTDHPITRGLAGWDMIDETYTMDDAGSGSEILLTVEHPRSMKTIAWTRRHKDSPVFCLELGHDNSAYANPSFRKVVHGGIEWCAGRL